MRQVIIILTLLAYVSIVRVAIDKTTDVPGIACETLKSGGMLFDRFRAGRGDVMDADGNIIARNLTDRDILRACFNLNGYLSMGAFEPECTGCPQKIKATPQVRIAQ